MIAEACWSTCPRCEGYGCRLCFGGEMPKCHVCGEHCDPDLLRTTEDANAWVDGNIARGACEACVATYPEVYAATLPAFGSDLSEPEDPFATAFAASLEIAAE